MLDKKTGLFAHPDKVHRLDYAGKHFRSRGPFTVPRSPQGHPVIIQAGQSGRGRNFAARWAELVFVNYHDLKTGKEDYATFKQQVAEAGRDPDKVFVAAGVYHVVAETRAEAEDKAALIDKLPKEIDQLSLLCEVLNVDLSKKPVDEPWTEEEIRELDRRAGHARPGDADHRQAQSHHARLHGSDPARHVPRPSTLRRQREGRGGRHGGMVQGPAPATASSWRRRTCRARIEDFARYITPELQRRGLIHKDYAGATLRENLGLARPAIGDWRRAR